MELKHRRRYRDGYKTNRSNRTFMELKRASAILLSTSISSSNRTFMELKRVSNSVTWQLSTF